MNSITIDIGRDFSSVPAGRHPEDGDFSGQEFRERLLVPALQRHDRVVVVLDNTEGFGSSFLEEAFGGLIRENRMTPQFLKDHLVIEANKRSSARYRDKVVQYIATAARLAGAAQPTQPKHKL